MMVSLEFRFRLYNFAIGLCLAGLPLDTVSKGPDQVNLPNLSVLFLFGVKIVSSV